MREPSRSHDPRPTGHPRSKAVRRAILALSATFLASLTNPPARALDCVVQREVLLLAWGEACERTLAANEALDLPFEVAADEYYQFNLTAAALDLDVELRDPDGRLVLQKAEPRGSTDYLVFAQVANRSGRHHLVLRAANAQTAGRFTLEFEKRRPAREGDVARAQAEMSYWDGSQIENLGHLDQSVEHYLEALAFSSAAKAPELRTQSLVKLGRVLRKLGQDEASLGAYRMAEEVAAEALRSVAVEAPLEGVSADLATQAVRLAIDLMALLSKSGTHGAAEATTHFLEMEPWAERLWIANRDDGKLLGELASTFAQATRGSKEVDRAAAALCQALDLLTERPTRAANRAAANVSFHLAIAALDALQTERALAWAETARARAEEMSGPAREELLASLANVACVAHNLRGELSLAQRSCQDAADRAGANQNLAAQAHDNLGAIFLDLGRPDRALGEYEHALENYPHEAAPEIADAIRNVGVAHFRLGRLDEAKRRFEQAETSAPDPFRRGLALHWAAKVDLESARPEEALGKLDRARDLEREGDPLAIADTELERASALARLGRTDEARQAFERSLLTARNDVLRKAVVLGRRAEDLGNLDAAQALADATEAVEIVERLRTQVGPEAQRRAFFAHRHATHATQVRLLLTQGRAEEAFASSESARARGLLDLLAEGNSGESRDGTSTPQNTAAQDSNPTPSGNLESELYLALSEAKRRRPQNPQEIADLEARLAAAKTERERFEERAWRENPRYAEVRFPKPSTVAEIQATLDDETALLEYLIGSDGEIYLFVVTRESVSAFTLSAYRRQPQRLERDIRSLTDGGLARGFWTATVQGIARGLHRNLISPAAQALAGKRRLVIAPDGPLYGLPFEVLLGTSSVETPESPLVVRYAISYAPSASVLARLTQRNEARSETTAPNGAEFVAFGDPAYVRAPALPATRAEVEQIAALFPEGHSRLFLGERANKGTVRQETALLAQARYLHFATHGDLLGEQPDLVGLRLAPEPLATSESLLQAREIFELDLPAADLVVLSACSSGLGQRDLGEGIVGLPRAFFSAGARSVAVSLWPVADQKAASFMVSFYRELLATPNDKAGALQRAKLAIPTRPDVWAPFILLGAPR